MMTLNTQTLKPAMQIDPVCGMSVDPSSPHKHSHGGEDYSFCSAHCLTKFKKEPAKYARKSGEGGESAGSCCSTGGSHGAH
ncbi:MAG TPA: YHS domain-containing protein, partial [Bdellovibrionales bacterium]|nr:YHS domain-containing protein [Bdellovibrionales bacterium]